MNIAETDMAVHQHFDLIRIVVESGRLVFLTRDLFLKSIALAQIYWMSPPEAGKPCPVFPVPFGGFLGMQDEGTNPS